jgi:CheY-like chemotaxis protein
MQTSKRILLVDDDEDFVEIHRTILEPSYDVAVAYSAKEGLEIIQSGEFDLFIFDIMMEERDSGFSLTYTVRNDPRLKNIPIMLLTSAPKVTGFSFDLERDKDWLKVDDLVEKPVKANVLLEKVAKLLSRKSEEGR